MHPPTFSKLQLMAQAEIDRLLLELPPPIQEQVRHIPIILKQRPSPDMITDGLDSDLLGLFVGNDFVGEDMNPMPPEILFFLANIWDEAEGSPDRFRQEIRTTFLHELGHYLGLDEDDLFDRDLE